MKPPVKHLSRLAVIAAGFGLLLWLRPDTLARSSGVPVPAPAPVAAPPLSGGVQEPQGLPAVSSFSPQASFKDLDILKRNAILDDIRNRDLPSIFQAWIDADRVDHDPLKRKGLSMVLSAALHTQAPGPEFLAQLRAFINDSANATMERAVLLSVIGYAQREETIELLLDFATHPVVPELNSAVLSAIGAGGVLNNMDERVSPVYDKAWRNVGSGNKDLLHSIACSMARLGATSSMQLLLSAALAPDGQDDARRHAARSALDFVTVLNPHAVPPLAARLSDDDPGSKASQLAGGILFKMQGEAANRALASWMQRVPASAAPGARYFATNGQSPGIWQANADSAVPYRSEKVREAIREGVAAYWAARRTQP
jgi:hypothetical protein